MNNSFIRIVAVICAAMLTILNVKYSLAGNYTWTGSADKEWNNPSNWSPSGTPSTNDTVTIGTGSDTLLIAANTTINRLVISGRVVNLGGYLLEISQRASLNGGKMYNGTLKIRGTYAFFQGTNTNCTIDCIVNQIKLSGGTFDGTGTFEQNGTANGWGDGGCVFNGAVTMKKSGTASFRLGGVNPDTFNGKATFICTNSGNLEVSHGSHSVFRDSVFLNTSHSTAHISFCNSSTLATLEQEAVIVTGATGLTNGKVTLKALQQTSNKSNILSGTGNLLVNVDSCQFTGEVRITSPSILIKNNIFNGATTLIKTTASTNSYSSGGNIFNSTATIENQDATRAFRLANETGDTYKADVSFIAGSNNVQVGYKGNNYFAGNITINSNKVVFNASTGKVILNGENNQILNGETAYAIGKLEINKDAGTVQLNRSLTIDSSITFVNGIINTDSTITLKAAVSCSGASNQSFVDGPVKKIGNTAFVFPVGDESYFYPIKISAPANSTDAFKARYLLETYNFNASKDSTLASVNSCGYWNLTRENGTSNVKINLSWDSLGCGIYDTSGLVISHWSGSQWLNLGVDSIAGNSLNGTMSSPSTVNNYGAFTYAYKKRASTSVIMLELNPNTNDLSWHRPISRDFLGYNGANILFDDQTWNDLFADGTLKKVNTTMLRVHGGTVGNYWDWRSGWFFPEQRLANNWFYFEEPYTRDNSDYIDENKMPHIRSNAELFVAKPLYQLNNLTSDFYYQLGSLYYANELNMPVEYIELGEEFYLNDEHYKEVFPSVNSYVTSAKAWCQQLKGITPFSNVKVAIVGANSSPGSPGRRRLWLEGVLNSLSAADEFDAITIHDYIPSGLGSSTFSATNFRRMIKTPFEEADKFFDNELAMIEAANSSQLSAFPLKVWMTEYNLNDKVNHNIGTWAHGLFEAVHTLKFLENPLIENISSHAMSSDAAFGNIYESASGFEFIANGMIPNLNNIDKENFETRKGEFTSIGNTIDQIARAMRNATMARRLDFSNSTTLIDNISYLDNEGNIVSTTYPYLYGWVFDKDEGREAILLNLDPRNDYTINITDPDIFDALPCNYEQLQCPSLIHGTRGSAITGTPTDITEVYTTQEIPVTGGQINLLHNSITRIIYRNPNTLSIRLMDNEICEGSTTTAIVLGAEGSTISMVAVDGNQQITQLNPVTSGDSLFIIPGNLGSGTYTITAYAGGQSSNSLSLTIYENKITSLTISATTPSNPCADPVTLTATITPTTTNTGFTYLWVPTDGITAGLPNDHQITVDPEQTQDYEVYVTVDGCWAHSNTITVKRGPSKVSLGEDITTCVGQNVTLTPYVFSQNPNAVFSYIWSDLSTNSSITVNNSSIGPYAVSVNVTEDGCTVSDEIIINYVSCCTCSSTVNPLAWDDPDDFHAAYTISRDESLVQTLNASAFVVTQTPATPWQTSIAGNGSNAIICINGELWIDRRFVNGEYNRDQTIILENCTLNLGENARIRIKSGATLIIRGCILKKCDGSTKMWDGIYADIEDLNFGEPELEVEALTSNNTIISDAKTAINLFRDSPYIIQNCDFTNNYIDISISKYQRKVDQERNSGISQEFFIRSNTFTSSGNTLLSPYNNVHKFAAIVLDDVERVVIGDSSQNTIVSANEISESNYGAYILNSSVEFYNTDFDKINELDGEILESPSKGACIYNFSNRDFNDREITIGNVNATNRKNNFTASRFGFVSQGEVNCTVINNVFGSATTVNDRIELPCINIGLNTNKKIFIGANNSFYDYSQGILLNNFTNETDVEISSNVFYNGFLNDPARDFDGTAIRLNNTIPIQRMNTALVANNEIGVWDETNGIYYQPRIGIHLANTGGVEISNNIISFNLTAVPSLNYRGIRLENAAECAISGNSIANRVNTVVLQNQLVGIRLDNSSMPRINCNGLGNLGQGMQFVGNNDFVNLIENDFNQYDLGILLGDGVNGTFIGDVQGAPGVGLDNSWVDDDADRVEGSVILPLPMPWYHRYAVQFENLFAPVRPDDTWPTLSIRPEGNQAGVLNEPCSNLADPSASERSAGFASIAADTARYIGSFADEYLYLRKSAAFSYLVSDTGRITMRSEDDEVYETLYEVLSVTNISKVDSVVRLCSIKKWSEAFDLLESIEDTNSHEYYLKLVFGTLIGAAIENRVLNSSDTTALTEIGNLHSLEGGLAVKIARASLQREIEDVGSGSRLYNNEKNKIAEAVKIWPNPTNDILQVNRAGTITYRVFDASMRLVLSGSCDDGFINVQGLNEGYYMLFVSNENSISNEPIGFCKLK